ncbi:hypothetical protein WR25_10934 [Diploscapter pachys]|uniref:Uncharacterized protein n=1 Tax=Diploscapter pachys TaxID=2018661 RepID=A0A2A2K7U4_9BILA|nr:hypothetical protein WR25_10934 [Diploscapter pachys]
MPYIDKSGNVVDKKPGWNLGNGGGIVGFFASIFAFLIIFLKSLFGMDTEDRNEGRSSSSFRRRKKALRPPAEIERYELRADAWWWMRKMGSSASALTRSLINSSNGETQKILLLGCMASGKTALCRQLMRQSKSGSPVLEYYTHTIQNNVLQIWREMESVCALCHVDLRNYKEDFDIIAEFRHREHLADRVRTSIRKLSKSGLYDECSKKRSFLPLPPNYQYFIQHTRRIISRSYAVTEQDILVSYAPTIGFDTQTLRLGYAKYQLMELPGHHIFRRKWSDFYSNTRVLCFVVDLSELCDEAFYTGHLKNKTYQIYNQLTDSWQFTETAFILLFNKRDLFDTLSVDFDFKQHNPSATSREETLSRYKSKLIACSPVGRSYSHVVSLIKAPNLGNTFVDSLNKIFKQNKENIHPE